ncbi:hypothetical protein AB0B88_09810 [Micromonospora haikouensis]|uniref:hypothetical protein n=1 Tax=Micromonospora haikouensis TaxID=686309 RepID=UPI0033FD7FB9
MPRVVHRQRPAARADGGDSRRVVTRASGQRTQRLRYPLVDHVRISTVVLTCVSVLALAACGGQEPAPTAAPTSAAATATTAAAAPTTGAAAPTAAAPASADPAADKKLCETAKKVADDSKKALMKAVVDGGDPAAAMKKAFTEMSEVAPATGGSGSEVAIALAAVGAEARRIANAADVEAAAEDSAALEKAGAKANAACKKVGVDPNL